FDSVQNTYVTLRKPYKAHVNASGHPRQFDVFLIDTQLLVPGSSKSLATLGDLYSFPKLELGSKETREPDGTIERVPYIKRMDLLLHDSPALYREYAIRDAEICARHLAEIMRFEREELGH